MAKAKKAKDLKGITVKLSWCGAVPTLIRQERGGEKILLKPGESIDVKLEMTKAISKSSKILINAESEDVKALTKNSIVAYKERVKREKDRAKKKAGLNKPKEEESKEEELEEIEEEEAEDDQGEEVEESEDEATEEEAGEEEGSEGEENLDEEGEEVEEAQA